MAACASAVEMELALLQAIIGVETVAVKGISPTVKPKPPLAGNLLSIRALETNYWIRFDSHRDYRIVC